MSLTAEDIPSKVYPMFAYLLGPEQPTTFVRAALSLTIRDSVFPHDKVRIFLYLQSDVLIATRIVDPGVHTKVLWGTILVTLLGEG